MTIDTSSIQFLIGKKISQVITANLQRKFGKVKLLRPGAQQFTIEQRADLVVHLDSDDKITKFSDGKP
jgi:hypothetical protein